MKIHLLSRFINKIDVESRLNLKTKVDWLIYDFNWLNQFKICIFSWFGLLGFMAYQPL